MISLAFSALAASPDRTLLELRMGEDVIEMRDAEGCVTAPLRDGASNTDLDAWTGQVQGAERRQSKALWASRWAIRDGVHTLLVQKVPYATFHGRVYFEAMQPLRPFFDCDYAAVPAASLVEGLESLGSRRSRAVLMELIAAGLVRSGKGMTCGWAVGEHARDCWRGSCTQWVDRVKQLQTEGCPERPIVFSRGWPGQRTER